MSQPPYPPGPPSGPPPGYGYQPGPGQAPGGYPGQGGYPPPGGYPQQPGYGQYGQSDQYGQTPQYGYPGGYGPPVPPRRKSSLPWLLAGGGVLVIAVAVVLILTLTGGSDTSTPQGVAEAVVAAANDRDADKIVELSCAAEKAKAEEIKRAIDPSADAKEQVKVTFELGKVTENGDRASAEVKLKFENVPTEVKGIADQVSMNLLKEDGRWTFCGFGSGRSSSGSS